MGTPGKKQVGDRRHHDFISEKVNFGAQKTPGGAWNGQFDMQVGNSEEHSKLAAHMWDPGYRWQIRPCVDMSLFVGKAWT